LIERAFLLLSETESMAKESGATVSSCLPEVMGLVGFEVSITLPSPFARLESEPR
jgi:hypothetical protein